MSLIKLAAAKWRDVAKRIVRSGIKTEQEGKLVNALGVKAGAFRSSVPVQYKSDDLLKGQTKIRLKAFGLVKETKNTQMKDMHEKAWQHHDAIGVNLRHEAYRGLEDKVHNPNMYERPQLTLKHQLGNLYKG